MPQLYDPRAYRKRSVPVASEVAQENVTKFVDAVRAAMDEFQIADCLVVAETNVIAQARDLTETDAEATSTVVAHIGDVYKSVPMAAYGHAYMHAEFTELVNRRKASGAKRGAAA
ncbi:MAG: hypothetical protein E6Q78_05155 [Rhodoferax sp.]|nr:MAG: hypothetical protein E6Q78_05155 [Rhodoferax sp.]